MYILFSSIRSMLLLVLILQCIYATQVSFRQASPCQERCLLGQRRVRNVCSRSRTLCRVQRCRASLRRRGYICTARPSPPSTQSPIPSASNSPVPSTSSSPIPSSSSSPVPSTSSSSIPSVSSSPTQSSNPSPIPSMSSPSVPSVSTFSAPSTSPTADRFLGALICVFGTGQETFNVGVINKAGELHIASFSVEEDTARRQLECIQNDISRMSVEDYLEFADENCAGEESQNCIVNDLEAGDCRCFLKTPVRCLSSRYRRSLTRCANNLL